MTSRSGRRIVVELFRAPLSALGFSHAGALTFSQSRSEGIQLISFSCRKNKDRDICISFGAGIRFEAVEKLLGTTPDQRLFPTVSKPLSVLSNESSYPEWCFSESSDHLSIQKDVINDIQSFALPFLDRFSTLESVRIQLEDPDPHQWFVLDPEQRIAILASIVQLQGDPARALALIDEALADMPTAPSKKRQRFERLRNQILSHTT